MESHWSKSSPRNNMVGMIQGASTRGNASDLAARTDKESAEHTFGSQVAYSDLVTRLRVGLSV